MAFRQELQTISVLSHFFVHFLCSHIWSTLPSLWVLAHLLQYSTTRVVNCSVKHGFVSYVEDKTCVLYWIHRTHFVPDFRQSDYTKKLDFKTQPYTQLPVCNAASCRFKLGMVRWTQECLEPRAVVWECGGTWYYRKDGPGVYIYRIVSNSKSDYIK